MCVASRVVQTGAERHLFKIWLPNQHSRLTILYGNNKTHLNKHTNIAKHINIQINRNIRFQY